MKALFKRNSPPPPAPTPTSPFPTFDTIREGAVPSLHSLRNRGFSFTKDAFTSPVKVVSAPIAHQTPSSPKTYMTNRKRLQSGGITFDEVLPTSATPAVPLPPQPLLKAVPPILRPVLYSTCPRPGLTAPAITHSQPASTSERAGVPDVIAAPTCYPSSTGYARPHSNRPRRGTNEVGMYTPHIYALIALSVPASRMLDNSSSQPEKVLKRAASLDDLRKYPSYADSTIAGKPTPTVSASAPATTGPSPQPQKLASHTDLLASSLSDPALPVARPRATSVTASASIVAQAAGRRPALHRGVKLHPSSQTVELTASASLNTAQKHLMDPLEDHHLARSTLPSGTRKTFAAKSCTPSARRPPIAPLQTATHRSQEVKPVLSVNPAPHTPLGTFSAYPDRTRDLNVQVPFPNSPASPRTILTPPTDPQIELALRVDATRISLGRYEAEQDLTFSVRVDNSVADDVEVQLVTTKEGTEVVYELKIRKKDPYGLRVRDGIIPYTYVPPFSSVSSSSGWSSICSSPVTTPPLEVPPFHQYGSYFPPQYMSGGSWRTPKRTSTSKGSRSSRSSGSTVRTPTAGSKLNGQTSYFMVGNAPVTPPAGKMMATQISLAQYDSDADDSDDNSSFLDHNASGQGYLVPRLTPAYGVRGCMLQTRSEAAISLHSSHQNDATMACDSNNGLKPITDDYPWLKSHFSDTEVEVETESEEDSSTERVSLVEISS